jgi:asparagine synthase (glutamine-hydrolysing)
MALDFKIKRALRGLDYDPRLWLPIWMAPIDIPSLEELFSETVDIEDLYSEAIEQWAACPQTDLVDKTLQFYTKLYLQDDILVKVDRASMMHSLEVRAPFLDIELVNFVRRIPSAYKLRNGTTKYILRKAFQDVLPSGILHRRKKGFGVPLGAWFTKSELSIAHSALPSVHAHVVARKLAAHRAAKSNESAFLWSVYVLDKWAAVNQVSF